MDDTPRTKVPGYAPERSLRDRTRRPATRTRLRRLLARVAAVLLLVGLALAINRWIHTHQGPQVADRLTAKSAAQPVAAATIGAGDIRITINALGTVTPIATITVMTQINGQLTEVGFEEGQHVRKGDFLAQVDPRPYQAAKEQAEGQLTRDQGLLDQARMDLARYQNLSKTQAIPRQQAEDQVYIVKQYEGTVKADQAQVDMQALNLVYCRIVSPVTGRVGLRLVDPGNYVQTTNTSGIAVVTQMQPITVVFPVPEDHLPAIRAQMRAGKRLEATAYDRGNKARIATGRLAALDSQIDTSTGTVKLRAEFANEDEELFPNQFVNVRLLVDELHQVVVSPIAAIQHGAPGTYVYLITADDTVSVRPVKVGATDGEMVRIESGLAAGDRVVVDGADRLRDGARVSIPSKVGERRPPDGGSAAQESPTPDAEPRRDRPSGPTPHASQPPR